MTTSKEDSLDLRSKCRFVQFQLWRDCNCNCDFCYNKGLKDTNKVWSLNAIINKIKTDSIINKFNEIGFIGGETFGKQLDDPEVKNLFYVLMQLVVDRVNVGQIKKIYITTSLLYKNTDNLVEFIEFIKNKNILDKVLICTSYDTIYRFKNENSEELWRKNMSFLHNKYSDLAIHTETILTQDFIEKVLSGEFNILKFQKELKTKLNFIEPQCNSNCDTKEQFNRELPRFLPNRKDFIKFIRKVYSEGAINIDEFLNESLHSDLLYLECDGYLYEFLGRRRFPTLMDVYYRKIGRNFYHLGYADSDIKMEDDVQSFKELIQ